MNWFEGMATTICIIICVLSFIYLYLVIDGVILIV